MLCPDFLLRCGWQNVWERWGVVFEYGLGICYTFRSMSKKMGSGLPGTVWKFLGEDGTFRLENPGQFSRLYFPLANEAGMLSNITPKLKGSIQTGHNAFLTLPVSIEDLHNSKSNRNFWVLKNDQKLWSATGVAKNKTNYDEKVSMEGGLLWHKLIR